MRRLKIIDIIRKIDLVPDNELKSFLKNNNANRMSDIELGELMVKNKLLTKEQMIPIFDYYFDKPYREMGKQHYDPAALKLISEDNAKRYHLIPLGTEGGKIRVVMADPKDIMARDEIKRLTKLELEIYWSFWSEIEWAIDTKYTTTRDMAEQAVAEIKALDDEVEKQEEEDDEVQRAPIVRLLNSILEQAVRDRASDIHIEPFERYINVRIRVDGDLKEIMKIPSSSQDAIAARVKILSNLDIAERRVPQDGRIQLKILERPFDLRVSVLPSIYGEKIVFRVLDKSSAMLTKEQLGFTPYNARLFDKALQSPEGIVLLSGPTGSGKTTTLYGALNEIVQPKINVVTVEDPVEYRLEGINQVQVNEKSGLTFAAGLRAILRQDPDVVMVGEIRDAETAQIAVRASITGHMVLSTIHTNDTVSTVMRLADMGIEVYMVASALNAVIAQRLVKRVCYGCKKPRQATPDELAILSEPGPATVYEGTGCSLCEGSGYKGRIAIHEILLMDKELRAMVIQGATADKIKDRAKAKGLKTLRESCKELVLDGITSVSEMKRTTYSLDTD